MMAVRKKRTRKAAKKKTGRARARKNEGPVPTLIAFDPEQLKHALLSDGAYQVGKVDGLEKGGVGHHEADAEERFRDVLAEHWIDYARNGRSIEWDGSPPHRLAAASREAGFAHGWRLGREVAYLELTELGDVEETKKGT